MMQFFFAMLMCLTFGVPLLSGQDKAPSILVDNPVKDFGKVMVGETVKHVFSFSNSGSGTLEILEVEPTCGCQAISLTTKRIEPGQSGQLEVSVDTTVMSGPVTESVTMITNDPSRPSILLTIKADVQPEVTLSRPSVYFGDLPKGKEVTEEVILTIPEGTSTRILSAESNDESVSVRLEPVPESNGKQVRLLATCRADGKTGYRLGDITVKTTSHLTPELTIHFIIRNFNR